MTLNKRKIVVIGDVLADMITNIVSYPPKGEGTYGTPLERKSGGTGGNIAAGLGVLGADVSIIGGLGDDEDGEFLKYEMREYQVDTTWLRQKRGKKSGTVIIAVTPDGERTIWVLSQEAAYECVTIEDLNCLVLRNI